MNAIKQSRLCLSGEVLVLALAVFGANASPIIFHSTETAGPGEVIGLQGANFGEAPQVWMQHVTGSEGALAPQARLTVLTNNPSCASALIPLNETPGLYAIWIKDGAGLSAPILINRARAWGANDLCGTNIDSGRAFRLFGRNLCLPGATPTVRFVNGSTSLSATVSTNGSDPFILNVTAPTLVPGAIYDIYVNNGFGGASGESKSSLQLKGRADGMDDFGLGVPWAADFTFSANVYNVKTDARLAAHALGDGATDDTAALQGAINAANNAGGGVVYLPGGTYRVTLDTVNSGAGLRLKSNVVLQGAGTNVSHLRFTGSNPAKHAASILAQNVSLIGFMDLDIHNMTDGGSINILLEDDSKEVFALRTLFQTDAGNNLRCIGCGQILVSKCSLASSITRPAADGEWDMKMLDDTDVVLTSNDISWHIGYVELYRSVRTLIGNNHFTRDTRIGGYDGQKGGFYPTGSRQVVIHGNTFAKSGPGQFFDHNDGETILEENCNDQPNQDLGSVTSATATTLTDSGKNWSVNYGAPINRNTGRGYSVAIIAGLGAGQLRKIIDGTANALTVDKPWDVIPARSDHYTIQYVEENELIYSNKLTSGNRGIWIYSSTIQDQSIVNNTLTDNDGIWMRTDYRPFEKEKRFNVQFDVYVAGNRVEDLAGWYSAYIGSSHQIVRTNRDFGTSTFLIEYRNNTIVAHVPNVQQQFSLRKESYYSTPVMDPGTPYPPSRDDTTISHLGTIFQNNAAINTEHAFEFGTGDYYHVVWNTTTNNVEVFLHDQAGNGATHASIGTVIGQSPGSATGPLKVHSSNSRYFADRRGKVVFLTGSHTWDSFQDYTYAALPSPPTMNYDAYLSFLKEHGHNFFRLWTWECSANPNASQSTTRYEPMPYRRPGPGIALDGKPKFDLTRFDPDYFDRMRTRVMAARDRGIYVSIMLFNGFSIEGKGNVGGDPWQGHPFNPANNINGINTSGPMSIHTLSDPAVTALQQAYVRQVIDAVNDLDNVLYEVSNEDRTSPEDIDWQYSMIRLIHSYEATKARQHPVGMTQTWPNSKDSTLLESPADWISPSSMLPDGDGRKVVLNDTDHSYFWTALKADGPASQRAWVWENFMRGNQCLFMDPYLDPSHDAGRNDPAGGKPDRYWDNIRDAMGQTRCFADRMNLAETIPHGEFSSTSFCLADPGAEYLVYQPRAGETFSLQLKPGVYYSEWFDPEKAVVATTDRIESSGGALFFSPPFGGDAALYLKAE
jgi:hypothetical protein